MAFLFLAVNATYLYMLIPITGKTESWRDRLKEWHELTDEMAQRLLAEELRVCGTSRRSCAGSRPEDVRRE
jgi:hypothetical protein